MRRFAPSVTGEPLVPMDLSKSCHFRISYCALLSYDLYYGTGGSLLRTSDTLISGFFVT